MHAFWKRARLPFAVILLLLAALFMARLFSGPEDDWTRNNQREWVRHGNPSAPMPSADYRPPVAERVLPWLFLASFVLPLFFIGRQRHANRLTFESATRDIRFFGYFGTSLGAFGMLAGFATAIEFMMAYDATIPARPQDLLVFVFLAGISGLCILLGALFFLLRRSANDHFHLERGQRELLDALERLERSAVKKPTGPQE